MLSHMQYSIDGIGEKTTGERIFTSDVATVNMLRIMSRVAVGMRVARVLINLRRARKLSGHVTKALRTTVSQNRSVCARACVCIFLCVPAFVPALHVHMCRRLLLRGIGDAVDT